MTITLRPQVGPQEDFLATSADIAIYGGGAGGGKSWALLYEPLRHMYNSGFGGVIFRREMPQIRNEGGLWDESEKLYGLLGAIPRSHTLDWTFKSGASVSFGAMEHEKDVSKWQGAQICYLGFDELTHFTKKQFTYMLSRNRSTCGVKPYIRATCNPDPDSFVRELIDWWIGDDGFPIKERSGVIRWMVTINDETHWAEDAKTLIERFGEDTQPKSFTFIPASVYDNKILLDKDPGYVANLKAMSLIDRMQLLDGNWNVRADAGMYFKRHWFEVLPVMPALGRSVRRWDLAATKDGGDWTVGLKMTRDNNGLFYVEDVIRFQGSAQEVERAILNTASIDGHSVAIGLPQDPGQAGVAQSQYLINRLSGYNVKAIRETGSKGVRAMPVSSQAEVGNIKLIRGNWNEAFLKEAENFAGDDKGVDDQIDALSGAMAMLTTSVSTIRVI